MDPHDDSREAGPSRRPLLSSSPDATPRRSTSLTSRQWEKQPMLSSMQTPQSRFGYPEAQPTGTGSTTRQVAEEKNLLSPNGAPTFTPSALRRAVSDEGRSRSYTEPRWPIPSTQLDADPDRAALLQNARMKMSSQDQEAMRRLRSTMAAVSQTNSTPTSRRHSPTEARSREGTVGRSQDVVLGGAGRSRSGSEDALRADPHRTPRPSVSHATGGQSSASFTIAVVGHRGVGKSSVIKRAAKVWGVSDAMTTTLPGGQRMTTSRTQVVPGGKLKEARPVNFVEVDIDSLTSSGGAVWATGVPPISGAILCYDATRRGTLEGIAEALKRLSHDAVPMIILACKSDPGAVREVDAGYGNSLGEPYNVGLIEVTSVTSEGKSKIRNGLRWLLFKLEQRSRRQLRRPTNLALAPHTGHNGPIQPISAVPPDLQSPDSEGHSSGGDRIMWGHARHLTMTSSELEGSDKRSSAGSLEWITTAPIKVIMDEIDSGDGVMQSVTAHVGAEEAREVVSEDVGKQQSAEVKPGNGQGLPPEPPAWISLEEIYRRVFSYIVTGEGEEFTTTFFLTYRRFSSPLQLMQEFRGRVSDIESAPISKEVQMIALQRIIGALVDWICQYPGDVIAESVQAVYREILASALRHIFLAQLTTELIEIEAELLDIEDVDRSWSYNRATAPSTITATPPVETPLSMDGSTLYSLDAGGSSLPLARERTSDSQTRPPAAIAADSAVSLSTSSISQEVRPASSRGTSDARLQSTAQLGTATPPHGNGEDFGFSRWSNAWNTLIRADPRTFAVELTMMQWQRFSMIRPRDIFRHDFGKERDGPVGDAITFFNHISRWVSTMILANPKPKHRAKTYERFMLIAHHLRRLNNYDSLYAVISGMQETSVHRLSQTHALVNQYTAGARDFGGYVSLMDPRNGYAQYRKVLDPELSDPPAIPLLTVILGMLNRLQAARSEDVRSDGTIQWDKFMKFGEIVFVISKCQDRGTIIPGDPSIAFQALIEQTPVITSEDGLFERSRMLEPANGVAVLPPTGNVLKKLANMGMRDVALL